MIKKIEQLGDLYLSENERASINALIDAHNAKEEVKEEKWPKEGDMYWYVRHEGEIDDLFFSLDINMYKKMKDFGNCFRTKEEAESARDKVKELLKSLK